MQFKWHHKNKPRNVFTEMQIEQKTNYEFISTNLKVNTPPGGTDSILCVFGLVGCVPKPIATNKWLFYMWSTDL